MDLARDTILINLGSDNKVEEIGPLNRVPIGWYDSRSLIKITALSLQDSLISWFLLRPALLLVLTMIALYISPLEALIPVEVFCFSRYSPEVERILTKITSPILANLVPLGSRILIQRPKTPPLLSIILTLLCKIITRILDGIWTRVLSVKGIFPDLTRRLGLVRGLNNKLTT